MKSRFIFLLLVGLLFFSCSTKPNQAKKENSESVHSTNDSPYTDDNTNDNSDNNDETETQESPSDNNPNNGGCNIDDGTYSATIDYNNPETGYSQTYTLDVEVQDCQVVLIDFPSGGYLDEDHISRAQIDEDGNANVDGEDGKTYYVHIDN